MMMMVERTLNQIVVSQILCYESIVHMRSAKKKLATSIVRKTCLFHKVLQVVLTRLMSHNYIFIHRNYAQSSSISRSGSSWKIEIKIITYCRCATMSCCDRQYRGSCFPMHSDQIRQNFQKKNQQIQPSPVSRQYHIIFFLPFVYHFHPCL